MECRFCFQKDLKPMLSPCRCNGTIKYVHASCLDRWREENINQPSFSQCSICKTNYIIQPIETFKLAQIDYTFCVLYFSAIMGTTFLSALMEISWKDIQEFFHLNLIKDHILRLLFIYSFLHQVAIILLFSSVFLSVVFNINKFFQYCKQMGLLYLLCICLSCHFFFLKLINDVLPGSSTTTLYFCLLMDMIMCFFNLFYYSLYVNSHNMYIIKSPTKVQNYLEN